jgi:hypothetical protein
MSTPLNTQSIRANWRNERNELDIELGKVATTLVGYLDSTLGYFIDASTADLDRWQATTRRLHEHLSNRYRLMRTHWEELQAHRDDFSTADQAALDTEKQEIDRQCGAVLAGLISIANLIDLVKAYHASFVAAAQQQTPYLPNPWTLAIPPQVANGVTVGQLFGATPDTGHPMTLARIVTLNELASRRH